MKRILVYILRAIREIGSWNEYIRNIDPISKKRIIASLILLPISIVFRESIESLVNTVFVNPVLSKVQQSMFKEAIFFTVATTSTLYFIWKAVIAIKNKRRLDFYTGYYLFFIVVIYSFYRFSYLSPYEFVSFTHYTKLYYFDVLIICAILLILDFKPMLKMLSSGRSMFVEDQPRTFISRDIFRRNYLINEILKNTATLNPEKAFAIGIQGEWGSGKSFVLNEIKTRIIGIGNPENIVVVFDPWKYDTPKELVSAFFKELTKKVDGYNPYLTDQLLKYGKVLVSVDENLITKGFNSMIETFSPPSTVIELYEGITQKLSSIQKRIHVFIDDLDRLEGNEVFEVLRLIRNTANFPHIIYYVAYDKAYISDVIKISDKQKNEEYLEKIFQLQITIPKISSDILRIELKSLLQRNRPEQEYGKFDVVLSQLSDLTIKDGDEISNFRRNDIIKAEFKTLRDVVRFTNMVNLELPLVDGQVDILDFLLLLILKFKHNEIYYLLKNEICLSPLEDSQNARYQIDIKKMEGIFNVVSINESAKFILEYLFTAKRNRIQTLSLGFVRNHMQYFAYDSFDKLTHKQYTELKRKITSKNRVQIATALKEIDESDFISILTNDKDIFDRDNYRKIIELYRVSYTSLNEVYQHTLLQGMLQLFQLDETQVKTIFKGKKGAFSLFMKSFFRNADSPAILESTLALYYLQLILNNEFENPPLGKDVFQKIIFSYFENYVTKEPLSEITFELFYKNYDSINLVTREVTLKPSACKLLKSKIIETEANKLFYAKSLIRPWGAISFDKDLFCLDPFVFKIFGNETEFEKFLYSLPESIENLELQAFYLRYKANDFKPASFERNFIEIVSDSKTEFIVSPTYPKIQRSSAVAFINPFQPFVDALSDTEPAYKYYKWIAHCKPEDLTDDEATNGGEYTFQRLFVIPESYSIERAELLLAVDDNCKIELNDNTIKLPVRLFQDTTPNTGKIIALKKLLKNGENKLYITVFNFDSYRIGHSGKKLTYKDNIYGIMFVLRIQLKKE